MDVCIEIVLQGCIFQKEYADIVKPSGMIGVNRMGVEFRVLALLSVVSLSACVNQSEITSPAVQYRAIKNLNAVGSSLITVRTKIKSGDKTSELLGAACNLQADGFSAKFTTPAKVVIPNLQERMPVANLTCTHDGKSKSVALEPLNKTVSEIHARGVSAGVNGGLIGIMVGGALAARETNRRDQSKDIYGYIDQTITFGN